MNIYEDEQYEIKMDRITDRMAYLILRFNFDGH
jgi:hypothetical protein